ncbi:3-hydroxyacyl-CoA dehydrogenase family protein [Bacillus fonticola]|uniref:3-hydroxyacyl-CoA dehydrogenase family protein n=1 Tax=Bacillus fonticola TaxID=2728853 RepID=UPI00147424D0|nr:3-hydroxyacyl-CoA dehydrogenase family protein [Bacillus fonticola]
MKKITVLGAGTMGHGIAQLFATAKMNVTLYDPYEASLSKAKKHMEQSIHLLEEEGILQRQSNLLDSITWTTQLEQAVRNADVIMEAAPEEIAIKHDIYKTIESIVAPDVLIASNTSTIPVTKLAEKLLHPERMIIAHFFNPAQIVPLVELVVHTKTAPGVVEQMKELLIGVGKTPILLKKDVPGFVGNRLQAALVREAFHLLEEGVADAADIDAAIMNGPGFRWVVSGPLETADYGGLDIWEKVMSNLAPHLDVSTEAPGAIRKSVEEGHLGVKTGQGIYDYDQIDVEKRVDARNRAFARLYRMRE